MQQINWMTVAVLALLIGGSIGAYALGASEIAQALITLTGIFIPGPTLLAKARSGSMRPPPDAPPDDVPTNPERRLP